MRGIGEPAVGESVGREKVAEFVVVKRAEEYRESE